jgi:hypothetical protein
MCRGEDTTQERIDVLGVFLGMYKRTSIPLGKEVGNYWRNNL